MDNFVNLHLHTCKSLLDGMIRLPDLINRLKEFNQETVCVTDHGNLYQLVDLFQAAQKNDMKAIAAFEAYTVENHLIKGASSTADEKNESEQLSKRNHLILWAKDNEGYKRLSKICSLGWTEGFYYRPRIDDKILEDVGTEGIMGASACFLYNTDVITKDGIKYISDITIDDEVLTHTGEYKNIIKPTNRQYSGNIYTFKTYGDYPIHCTADHKFLILRKDDLEKYYKYSNTKFFYTYVNQFATKIERKSFKQNTIKYKENWVEARHIHQGDYFLTPIDTTINHSDAINISNYLKDIISLDYNKYDINSYKFTDKLLLTKELLELLGIYYACGNITTLSGNISGIYFDIASSNTRLKDRIVKIMLSLFKLSGTDCSKISINQQRLTYTSPELYAILQHWFSEELNNRQFPKFLYHISPSLQIYFIKGLYLNSGYTKNILDEQTQHNYPRYILKIYSKELMYNIIHILHRNYINPLIKVATEYVEDYGTKKQPVYYIYLSEILRLRDFLYNDTDWDLHPELMSTSSMPVEINGVQYMKHNVLYIEKEYQDTEVFCCNVQDIHSFIANGVAVHNCIAGTIAQHLLHDDYDAAKEKAIYYHKLFHGDFWLELQPTEIEEQIKVNKGLIELGKELGMPLIVTTDAHYLKKEDKPTHDVLLCMQSKRTLDDPNRWSFHGNSYYVMNSQEITQFMNSNGHEILDQNIVQEAIKETLVVADKCNVHFDFKSHYLPKIPIPQTPEFLKFKERWHTEYGGETKDNEDYLRYLCIKSLVDKRLWSTAYKDRLNYELGIINAMDFPDYFLIYEDIARFCRDNNIPLGPGRGCGTAENIIDTNHGKKPLNKVRIGEFVTIGENKLEVVNRHEYTINEPLITLSTSNTNITMTRGHQILAIKAEDFNKGIRIPKWYKISELNRNDLIAKSRR